MDTHKQLLIIKGEDKTNLVVSYKFENGKYNIQYSNSSKVYSYNEQNVQILNLQKVIDPQGVIVVANGNHIKGVDKILDFGCFYRIILKNKPDLSFRRNEIQLLHNCLNDKNSKQLFNYFKETAKKLPIKFENSDESNIFLEKQYEKVVSVQDNTVLATYFSTDIKPQIHKGTHSLIYPFGLNQSQKQAVENAFSSQVSIIQGPPGTGKTQTILNIIANAVLNKKTVAVVSNNNSATLNVVEKLEKKDVSFFAAFLGKKDNKKKFLDSQNGQYPNMSEWELTAESEEKLSEDVKLLSTELDAMLNKKNRVAEIEQELLELQPEQHYFDEYYATVEYRLTDYKLRKMTSRQILSLLLEYEQYAERNDSVGLLKKMFILFRFGYYAIKLFSQLSESVIPYLQKQFYICKKTELQEEKIKLKNQLTDYSFDTKMEELSNKSLQLFRAKLAKRYNWRDKRKKFVMNDFHCKSKEFNEEYPVVLSTTYSIKETLSVEHIYDYLIIDEASQVNLTTGVLAFSCAKNVIVVGDVKQLPNVLTNNDMQIAEEIWAKYNLDEMYRFTKHSLLSSALSRWQNVPSVLLREHYRCHPKIIGFCNQKFYQGQLIIMTEDRGEENVITMYKTVTGNHARYHVNQRQIDVIKKEILPVLKEKGYQAENIGIITPYKDQVKEIAEQLGSKYEVATVHKFQGREKKAIILVSVDNEIGDFVDDPNMLNVAVSRAVKTLVVVMSNSPQNYKTNYGDLARYITYNNCEVVDSAVFSVFDLLYKEYAQQRRAYLKKHKRVSQYDSENLLYSIIEEIIHKEDFQNIDCAIHVSLASIVKNYELLNENEKQYVKNPLTHTDFLLFNKMDKSPVMAIEVDGVRFHPPGSQQSDRDNMKNNIFDKCGIPLLRIRTNESGERERIESMLKNSI